MVEVIKNKSPYEHMLGWLKISVLKPVNKMWLKDNFTMKYNKYNSWCSIHGLIGLDHRKYVLRL